MYAQTFALGFLGAFALDQAFLRGAVFESAYRLVLPQYREKIVRHEAGHFLLAYILGKIKALEQERVRGLFSFSLRTYPSSSCLRFSAKCVCSNPVTGCPLRGYVIDAYQALLRGVPGQAGTIFTDPKLQNELLVSV